MNKAREDRERVKGYMERGVPLPNDKLVKDSSQMEISKQKRPPTASGVQSRKSPRMDQ